MKKILFIQYSNPAAYPPLQHSSRILARAGWKILFLGTHALGADSLQFPHHDQIQVRQIKFWPAGWRQKVHYLCYCFWVIFWTLSWRPRFVYASDPFSCPIALLLSFLPRLKVVYHEHDSPNGAQRAATRKLERNRKRSQATTSVQRIEIDRQKSAISGFMRCVFWARRRLAGRARLCVLPNGERTERFVTDAGKVGGGTTTLVVWNCPSTEDISEPRSAYGGGDLWLLYHGSIVPSRLPLAVLEALSVVPQLIKLRIIGYETVGHLGYVDELRVNAKRLGIEGRVEFLGTVPERTELLNWCRHCDVGLGFVAANSNDFNEQYMIGASNKPFDYLSCGLAVLVADMPDWRQTYVDMGYGLGCDPHNPESIAAALRWFVDHPGEMRAMGERGRQRIAKDWNYEKQFAPVFEQMTVTSP